ncbi:phosphotriesterase [Streptomyces sp. NPDC059092]|uniref:phosphotriesterase family protein n=1 Tax=Streptomyces sp. NPDC059092 TaxID=3346725 RepID=UPI0036BEB5BA
MSVITTVRGDIAPADLGYTSMHEHLNADMSLMLALAERYGAPPMPADQLTLKNENLAFLRDGGAALSSESSTVGDIDFTTAELGYFSRIGGRAVCDASPIGLRGDVRALRTASERADVHVVFATGLYVADARPAGYQDMTEDEQVAFFRREVTDGVGDTGLRPGFLKCALSTTDPSAPLQLAETTTLRAIARVSAETGLSVHVHTAFPMSLTQVLAGVDIALDAGMSVDRLVMMHMDSFFRPWDAMAAYVGDMETPRTITTETARAVLDRGANVGLDAWSSTVALLPDDFDRMKGLVDLLRGGYGDQIVLGHDTTSKPHGKSYGGYGYTRFGQFVPPMLRQLGFDDDAYRRLVIDNPARILAHEA